MRRKQPTWGETLKQFRWAIPVLILCALFAWFHQANSYPLDFLENDPFDYIGATRWRVICHADSTRDTIYCTDPSTLTPCSLRVELHVDTVYYSQRCDSFVDIGWSKWSPPVPLPRHSGGTVTIDYDSLSLIIDSGYGPNLVSLQVRDTTGGGSVPISGALVTIKDVTLSTNIYQGFTATSGNLIRYTSYDSVAVHVQDPPDHFFEVEWDTIDATLGASAVIRGYHTVPPLPAAGDYVTLYLDLSDADIISGLLQYRDRIRLTLRLAGSDYFVYDSIIVVPEERMQTPTAGRVSWEVLPTTLLEPEGDAYYEIFYQGWSGRSQVSGSLRRFYVDTIPDPVNVMQTEEVWR